MQVVLVMFSAEGERRSFSIARDMTVMGRRQDCDLCIPVGDVSRKHCRLVKADDAVRIEDLGSSNGTYVNGQRIQESALNPGDWIQVGPVQFCVQIDGMPSDEELVTRAAGQADETTAGLAALDAEAAGGESAPEGSRAGDVYSEVTENDEVPLEDVPLEEADETEPVDATELEEIVDDDLKIEDDIDAPERRPH
jgi:pSer/pThr/pTyr-binding forkhead associated (FHA) protein